MPSPILPPYFLFLSFPLFWLGEVAHKISLGDHLTPGFPSSGQVLTGTGDGTPPLDTGVPSQTLASSPSFFQTCSTPSCHPINIFSDETHPCPSPQPHTLPPPQNPARSLQLHPPNPLKKNPAYILHRSQNQQFYTRHSLRLGSQLPRPLHAP